LKKEQIATEIEKHDWIVWVGFITHENDDGRQLDYYGKFADTKKAAIGAAKVMIDNTSPYRIIIQNCKPFHTEPLCQSKLHDFFQLEDEE
jgi:hypothetical protein